MGLLQIPFVVENVIGAPIPEQPTLDGRFGVLLCGTSFGARYWRHRLFETSFLVARLPCTHAGQFAINPYNSGGSGRTNETEWRDAMGVSWMVKEEYREAIPPVYTEYIGVALLATMRGD